MYTFILSVRSRLITCGAFSSIGSQIATAPQRAKVSHDPRLPATRTTVPFSSFSSINLLNCSVICTLLNLIHFLFPTSKEVDEPGSSTTHSIPKPGFASKFDTWENVACCSLAWPTMAFPTICSEWDSAEPSKLQNSWSSSQPMLRCSTTDGIPLVMVPVLSNTTAVIFDPDSIAPAPLIKIPCFAPTPVLTITAVGVARPSAQGQDITSTATPNLKAKTTFSPVETCSRYSGRMNTTTTNQTAHVRTARPTTIGTKYLATRSAYSWMGALDVCASSTNLTICASAVSDPTRTA
mmetsp:Transcript_35876/g.57203  ORF Transcript_35876/g.57203 Transcript_35876/m.57203 type:complete len:294 (-) Transcript_35876:2501-3382(-)